MPGLPQKRELESLIESAMKENAPSMHRQLSEDGTLAKVISNRADAATDSYEQAMSEAMSWAASAKRNLTGPESVNELTQARSRAAEEALRQAVEFEESPPENEEPIISRREAA